MSTPTRTSTCRPHAALLPIAVALLGSLAAPPGRAAEISQEAAERIRDRRGEYIRLADEIWSLAEPAMQEFRSALRIAEHLRAEEFRVEMGAAGMPTAFVARWGSGRPRIGFLVEYDGLPGLSQEPVTHRSPVPGSDVGHGCGHNLLGIGELAAAEAVAATLRERGLPGTVLVYGTPAEETGVGKVFMARAGLFDELDVSFNWHPADETLASYGTSLALNSARFRFRGVAAHAAAAPEEGSSALDAVEIMNVAVNYLREHVAEQVRIHYAITQGGEVPNVVPAEAEVWYFVRAPKRAQVEEVYAKVVRCARAGALATGTELSVDLESALYEINPNETLARLMDRHLRALAPPDPSPNDMEFIVALRETLGITEGPPISPIRPPAGGWVWKASTDVGDVSWIAPTMLLKVAAWPAGCPAHSWQAVASGKSELGYSGMLWAAQTMAATAVELVSDPDALERVQQEFRRRTEGFTFRSGVPEEIGPPTVEPPRGYPSGTLEP